MNVLRVSRQPRGPIAFLIVAALMFAIDGTIARSHAIELKPTLIGGAIAFDLTIGVLFAYWLIVVRPGRASAASMVGVFVVSMVGATLTLGSEHLDASRLVRYFGIPFELAVVGVVAARVREAARQRGALGVELDVPERIRDTLGGTGIHSRVASVVATEMAVFYYAVASWRRKPFIPSGALGFAYHKKNGYAGLLYTVVRIALVEAIAIDFVIRVHHPVAANVFLAVDLLTALWVLGFARSVVLRPILVTRDEMRVRNGLQWRLDIPRAQIERIDFGKVSAPPKHARDHLRTAPGRANVLVELRAPLRAIGPYGFTREVRRVSLVLDDVAGFRRAVLDF